MHDAGLEEIRVNGTQFTLWTPFLIPYPASRIQNPELSGNLSSALTVLILALFILLPGFLALLASGRLIRGLNENSSNSLAWG